MLFGRRERHDVQSFNVVQFARHQRRAVQQLIGRADSLHTHLDWFETEHWLEDSPPLAWTAYQGTRVVGFLGLSLPLDGASWVRLAVVEDGYAPEVVLSSLWQCATGALAAYDVKRVALLVINAWITPYFERLGFHRFDEVITMRRSSRDVPNNTPDAVQVRPMSPDELASIIAIDHAAFASPWQMSDAEIRQAASMAASLTVATQDNLVVGYQLSTLYFDGAHLARLAVLPAFQGHGVGKALLRDLVLRFAQRGVYVFTVNTQESNVQSQRLYNHFAFKRNGYDLPVYVYDV